MLKNRFTGVTRQWVLYLLLIYALTIPEQCSTTENAGEEKPAEETVVTAKSAGFTGRWKQVADYFSIGDATIHWREVDSSVHQYLQFNADSTVESNIPNLAGFKTYSLINDSTMRFDSSSVKHSLHQVQLKATGLEISLHCIEACGVRLVKEKAQ